MAAVAPGSIKPHYDAITITGNTATPTATLIFDATDSEGGQFWWTVHIENNDSDAGDGLYIGFDSACTTTNGYYLGIFADGNEAHRISLTVPPGTRIYANCTGAETRDVRIIATPCL